MMNLCKSMIFLFEKRRSIIECIFYMKMVNVMHNHLNCKELRLSGLYNQPTYLLFQTQEKGVKYVQK